MFVNIKDSFAQVFNKIVQWCMISYKSVRNVVETTKPGCQVKHLDSAPILMRYKVRFTFENYRYSIKYL